MQADLTVGAPPIPEVEPEPLGDELLEVPEFDDAPHVDESIVRALVRGVGGGLEYVIGDDDVPEHWRFTERELDDLVPPLTRIINRRPQLRRAVARGDEAAIALVLAGYVGRNVSDGRAAKEARDAREREAGGDPGDAGARAPSHGGGPGPGHPYGAGGGPAGPGAPA